MATMPSVRSTCFKGRPAVVISNELISATVLCGGGHIALVQRAGSPLNADADFDFGSPLWQPPWPTCDPSQAELADPEVFGEGVEGRHLLPHIMGHNLCLDVFGGHTQGEVDEPVPGALQGPSIKAGMHGEAGACTWHVVGMQQTASGAQFTMVAHLRRTCLEVQRTFSVTASTPVVKVNEVTHGLQHTCPRAGI